MPPIEEFKLKIYIICIFVGNENTKQSSSTITCGEEYFQKKKNKDIFIKATTMMLIIMIITNDLTSSYSSSSIREIKLNDIFLTQSPDLLNALIQ